jgi:hypothetical protein
MGAGSRTGRGLGFCPPGSYSGWYRGGYFGRGAGRGGIPWGGGRGRAWGGGRGRGWWGRGREYGYPHPYADPWYAGPAYPLYGYGYSEPTPEEESSYLKDQLGALQDEMNYIQERLSELAKGKEEKKK